MSHGARSCWRLGAWVRREWWGGLRVCGWVVSWGRGAAVEEGNIRNTDRRGGVGAFVLVESSITTRVGLKTSSSDGG
jgi:hypothetical protein